MYDKLALAVKALLPSLNCIFPVAPAAVTLGLAHSGAVAPELTVKTFPAVPIGNLTNVVEPVA